ncbi:MAG: hypothetical protein C7B44_07245 [Sulfobacillus thermosulfidooxidans]|nr:MAG: hypothetical protein C7B44_07245 [Sulfobacillus thermosulfidooxidans]
MRLETALADNGDQYPVVVDADMRIIPEIFIFANFLCGTKQASPNTVVMYLRDPPLHGVRGSPRVGPQSPGDAQPHIGHGIRLLPVCGSQALS